MTTPAGHFAPSDALLAHHGDRQVEPGLVDLAVNVRVGAPPEWLRRELAAVDLARYPDGAAARAAVAVRHSRAEQDVLVTAGAAEAFVLVARAFAPRRAVVVHPQFTEPEIALRAAGHEVERVVLEWPFTLDPVAVPDDADLVVIGNPTNPTSVLHPAEIVRRLVRPGRVLVVDEAFADCVPGESESLAGVRDLPGVVVVRSLTKTWGLAGLRVGYVLAEPALIRALAAAQPRWAVSSPALAACVACCAASAVAEARSWALDMGAERDLLVGLLAEVPGVRVVPNPRGSFVLAHVDDHDVRNALLGRGFAVRRGDTFPGLGPAWMRIAVREHQTSTALANALKELTCPPIR
jgi:histidinol-phosphate aminotransferase